MHVILYQPGAYGDLVTSIIDRTDFEIGTNRIIPNSNRMSYVGKTNSNTTFNDIDLIYAEYSKKYLAISNHLFRYNIIRIVDFILIDTSADVDFEYCHHRAFDLVPDYHNKTLEENKKKLLPLLNNVKEKTNKIIKFSDILDGNLLTVLKQWISTPLNEDIYEYFMSDKFYKMHR